MLITLAAALLAVGALGFTLGRVVEQRRNATRRRAVDATLDRLEAHLSGALACAEARRAEQHPPAAD